MKKLFTIYDAIMLILILLTLFFHSKESKNVLKELKELNSTIEYIDKRMDTLEFYRIPEIKRK